MAVGAAVAPIIDMLEEAVLTRVGTSSAARLGFGYSDRCKFQRGNAMREKTAVRMIPMIADRAVQVP